jgi:hypothetical protein
VTARESYDDDSGNPKAMVMSDDSAMMNLCSPRMINAMKTPAFYCNFLDARKLNANATHLRSIFREVNAPIASLSETFFSPRTLLESCSVSDSGIRSKRSDLVRV